MTSSTPEISILQYLLKTHNQVDFAKNYLHLYMISSDAWSENELYLYTEIKKFINKVTLHETYKLAYIETLRQNFEQPKEAAIKEFKVGLRIIFEKYINASSDIEIKNISCRLLLIYWRYNISDINRGTVSTEQFNRCCSGAKKILELMEIHPQQQYVPIRHTTIDQQIANYVGTMWKVLLGCSSADLLGCQNSKVIKVKAANIVSLLVHNNYYLLSSVPHTMNKEETIFRLMLILLAVGYDEDQDDKNRASNAFMILAQYLRTLFDGSLQQNKS